MTIFKSGYINMRNFLVVTLFLSGLAHAGTFSDYYEQKSTGYTATVERLCTKNNYSASSIEMKMSPQITVTKKGKTIVHNPKFKSNELMDMNYALAKLYETGACGTTKNIVKAANYYGKAAELGREEAYFNLALLFDVYPQQFPHNQYSPQGTLTPVAYNMNKSAQFLLAKAYLANESKYKDSPESRIQAVKWLLLSAKVDKDTGESGDAVEFEALNMISDLALKMTPEQLLEAHAQASDLVKRYVKKHGSKSLDEKETLKALYEVTYPR